MCIDPGIDLNSSPQSRQTNTPKVQHTTNFDGGEKALHLTWVVVTSYIPRYWKLSRTNVDRVKNCVPRVQDRIATTYCHHRFYANRRRSGAHSRRASSRTRSFQTDEWTDGRTDGRSETCRAASIATASAAAVLPKAFFVVKPGWWYMPWKQQCVKY